MAGPCLYGFMAQDGNAGRGVIGVGFVFDGELEGGAAVDVRGTFRGSIRKVGELRIFPGAEVRAGAPVLAQSVRVAGALHGDCVGTERVHIREGGVVHGNIQTPKFGLSAGGRVEGKVSSGEDGR